MCLATCSLRSLALDWPCAAAMLSQAYAVTSSSGTPSPSAYMTPSLNCAAAVTLLGGEAEPPHRLGVVLGYTLAAGVHDPEIELRGGVVCSAARRNHSHRLGVVIEPELELRGGVTLLGGEAEPPHRLGVLLGHTARRWRT